MAPQGVPLPKGATRPITEGQTKFLGKLINISLSATKGAPSNLCEKSTNCN